MGVHATMNRPFGLVLWGACVILVHFLEVTCVSVHVDWNDNLSRREIFNASVNRDWNYRASNFHHKSENYIVEIRNGAVFLNSSVPCNEIENPLEIQILSTTENKDRSVVTLLPLKVSIVNGKNCIVPKHRKTQRRRKGRKEKYRIVVKSKNYHFNWCFQKHQPVLNVGALLPATLEKCKKVDFLVKDRTQLIGFNQKSRSFYAQEKFCTPSSEFSIFGHLYVRKCLKFQHHLEIPVKITFKNIFAVTSYSVPLITSNPKKHSRIRRQIENNRPVFPDANYEASVKERQNPGLHVITMSAIDTDSGDNGVIT